MERGRPAEVTVSVHQPNFLPWLKLLDKILASDVYASPTTRCSTSSRSITRGSG